MDKDLESLQALYVQKKMMLPSGTQQLKKEGENHLKKLKDAHVKTVFTFICLSGWCRHQPRLIQNSGWWGHQPVRKIMLV